MTQTTLYARVSTTDQTLDHQQAQAERAGFEIDKVLCDYASGSVPLAQRPEGKRLFDMLRSDDVLVVRWVDRLGRDYADVTNTIRELMQMGVTVRTVIGNMTFDGSTTDPMLMAVRDAQLAFLAATAQAQLESMKSAQKAGQDHAKQMGKYVGRKPSFTSDQLDLVLKMLGSGEGVTSIAKHVGLSRHAVNRIKADPAHAQESLARWARA